MHFFAESPDDQQLYLRLQILRQSPKQRYAPHRLYTGGTVLHFYLGEKIEDKEIAKKLIQKIFNNNKMPYISLTPTFSICQDHGYISGEHFECPTCGKKTEVWSRVVGYLRMVQDYNDSKCEEYDLREKFIIKQNQIV